MFRTHTCNELSSGAKGEKVTLSGWVHRRRDHGGVIFIDLRDRYGLTQIVSDPVKHKDAHSKMDKVRSEYVLQIKGTVRLRPADQSNPKLDTGEIEVLVEEIEILNEANTPAFEIDQDKEVGEDIRLKYRYLDLRRDRMKSNIVLRHRIFKHIRDFLDREKFLEIETPILIKGTPEGSREYIVPSRIYPGNFYVLPQSPQQLKQLLMIAGFDKYFQIARCFRDEDQRGDRQPEFTQLDVEMSFVDEEDVRDVTERLLVELTKKFTPHKKIQTLPFPVLTYDEAMNLYGSDKPDLRFDLPLSDITDIASECDFGVFRSAVEGGGVVKALRVEKGVGFTRKELDDFEDLAKVYGAKGLAYIVVEKDKLKSPIVKFFKQDEIDAILARCDAGPGDVVFFAADKFVTACEVLGQIRLKIAELRNLADENVFSYLWVHDFPMFEYDEVKKRLNAVHHPFTAPKNPKELDDTPENSTAKAYDVILNGNEIGGGSIRIHEGAVQKKVFNILGITADETERRFGHMLEAFTYGAPPHGGIAWGLDRLVMIFANEPNIREVIAFPKDQKAKDLMLGAPSPIPKEQLDELEIRLKKQKK